MATWFPRLVSALTDDGQAHPVDEIEVAFAPCTVHAAPVQEGQALGVTVRLVRQEDVDLFADLEVLRAMVRLHQGAADEGDWQLALSDDHSPLFVTTVAGEQVTPERFQALLDDAVAHVQLVLQMAQMMRASSASAIDIKLWAAQRG